MKTLVFLLGLTALTSSLQAADFDILQYAENLTKIENILNQNSQNIDAIMMAAEDFNQQSSLYNQQLILKFNNVNDFVGSDLYEMNHTLIVNHEINSLLIDLNARDLLLKQVDNFYREFYHTDGRVRRMMKAALKSLSKKDTTNEWGRETREINELLKNQTNQSTHGLIDSIIGAFNNTTSFLSFAVGNVATPLRLRNGTLYKNDKATKLLKDRLKPMDIILCRTPFTLSSQFIPGHFSHGGIYLGTKEQLLENGMWNDPSIVPYHNAIESGKVILEALINGVQINTIEHFLNIDEVMVMRRDGDFNDINEVSAQLKRGLEQVGKGYNYNFDVLQLDTVLCTELIYLVYNKDQFKTNKELGHVTIFPSDVANILFQEDSPYKLVINFEGTKERELQNIDLDQLKKNLQ